MSKKKKRPEESEFLEATGEEPTDPSELVWGKTEMTHTDERTQAEGWESKS